MLNHLRHRFVVALSVFAMSLGMSFIPTMLAQRVTQTQQDVTLRTLTLDGKGGANRRTDPQADSRPRPLSRAMRATLFKGRATVNSFTLTPKQPTFSDKARIYFMHALTVYPQAGGGYARFEGGSTGRLYFDFKGKAGQLYAIDISVNVPTLVTTGIYTLTNSNVPGATQTIPLEHGGQHITAYVTAAQDGSLTYDLQCSKEWAFYSVEVTEL